MKSRFKGTYFVSSGESCPALRHALMYTWGFFPAASIKEADLVVVLEAGELNRTVQVNSDHLYLVMVPEFEVESFRVVTGDNVLVTCERTREADFRQFLAEHRGWCRRRHEKQRQLALIGQ